MILNYISKFKQNQDSIFGLFNILKVSLLLLPISIILGNAAININTLIIIILFFINFFFNKTLNYNYKNLTLIFIFFLILLIINIFFSEYKYDSTKSTIGIIRYFLLMIAFLCCFENDKKFLNNFSRILFYIILFVAIDTLIQYFFGKDLFGIENTSSHGNRLSGPFGDEYIVGSYISKFIFISSIYLVFKNKKNITLIYILFLVVTVILTKERMASFMIVASSITFIFFSLYSSKLIYIESG